MTAASLADLVTYLPCDLMTKVDIASMAHGLECRRRFSTIAWSSWRPRCRSRYKLRGGRGKRILREAFGDLLPRQRHAAAEDGLWRAAGPLVSPRAAATSRARCCSIRAALGRGYFRPGAVERLLDEHQPARSTTAIGCGRCWCSSCGSGSGSTVTGCARGGADRGIDLRANVVASAPSDRLMTDRSDRRRREGALSPLGQLAEVDKMH